MEKKLDIKKLDIKKQYKTDRWDITLKPGQSIRFLTKGGYIMIETEIRLGELYLMKHDSVRGHTYGPNGKTFEEEMKQ